MRVRLSVPAFSSSSGSHFWIDNHLRYVCVFEIAGGLGLCGLVMNVLAFRTPLRLSRLVNGALRTRGFADGYQVWRNGSAMRVCMCVHVCMSMCVCVSLSVYPFFYLSVCVCSSLSVCPPWLRWPHPIYLMPVSKTPRSRRPVRHFGRSLRRLRAKPLLYHTS